MQVNRFTVNVTLGGGRGKVSPQGKLGQDEVGRAVGAQVEGGPRLRGVGARLGGNSSAKMAFVSRSKRETKGLTEQKEGATLPLVGPGSYINIDKYNTDHGYAPFSSTAERGLNSFEITDGKPGPGFYEKDVISMSVKKRASSNAFVSRVARFSKENPGTKQNPGPGTYSESNKWIKNSHQRGEPATSQSYDRHPLPQLCSLS